MTDDALASLLVDSVVDYAIFVLDPHGRVRTWNPGAQRVKGYEPDEIIGRDFSVFYTEEDREDGLPSRLLARAAGQGRVTHSGWRVRKDGTRFFGDVTITALHDEDDVLHGFAKVTRDRTDHHEAEVAMSRALDRERQAARELAEIGEARSRFMAAVAHDLGAPLGVIRGTLQMIDGAPDMLDVLRRNVDRLDAMARQLSELSRLQRGMLDLRRRPVDLAVGVPEVIASLGPALEGFEVVTDEVAGTVEVDRLAFERTLMNLLGNATQHAPAGTRIHVDSECREDLVVVSVEDEGDGIPEDDREAVFDEFRQGRHGGRGMGLGLSIVRHYARAHGGDAWAEEGRAGGARLRVSWPRSTAG